jgi:hypothetical protein
MGRIAVSTARIIATTATIPVRSCAGATAATAEILSWEHRLFVRSPLSVQARRTRRHLRELSAMERRDPVDLGSYDRDGKQQPAARSRGVLRASDLE